MITEFNLAVPPISIYPPSMSSNHIRGTAIDVDFKWTGSINVKKKDGTLISVPYKTSANANTQLHSVGKSYGVFKLLDDDPHWSHNGK